MECCRLTVKRGKCIYVTKAWSDRHWYRCWCKARESVKSFRSGYERVQVVFECVSKRISRDISNVHLTVNGNSPEPTVCIFGLGLVFRFSVAREFQEIFIAHTSWSVSSRGKPKQHAWNKRRNWISQSQRHTERRIEANGKANRRWSGRNFKIYLYFFCFPRSRTLLCCVCVKNDRKEETTSGSDLARAREAFAKLSNSWNWTNHVIVFSSFSFTMLKRVLEGAQWNGGDPWLRENECREFHSLNMIFIRVAHTQSCAPRREREIERVKMREKCSF